MGYLDIWAFAQIWLERARVAVAADDEASTLRGRSWSTTTGSIFEAPIERRWNSADQHRPKLYWNLVRTSRSMKYILQAPVMVLSIVTLWALRRVYGEILCCE